MKTSSAVVRETKRSKSHRNKSRQLQESADEVKNMAESPGRFDDDGAAVTGITKKELKLAREGDEMKWIGAMTKRQ